MFKIFKKRNSNDAQLAHKARIPHYTEIQAMYVSLFGNGKLSAHVSVQDNFNYKSEAVERFMKLDIDTLYLLSMMYDLFQQGQPISATMSDDELHEAYDIMHLLGVYFVYDRHNGLTMCKDMSIYNSEFRQKVANSLLRHFKSRFKDSTLSAT